MVKINAKIPDMALMAFHDGEEKTVTLSDYRGKWLVLFFYPADFTFVCPTELEEMADMYEEFRKYGAEVLSVSTDTHYVHKAWADASKAIAKIKYPMLADPTGKLARAFGTYIDDEGVSLRATFIIDPDGVLKSFEMNDNSLGRAGGETLRKLKAARYVRENPGEVCPASWEPGDDVLKPGLELVGKL
jgi:peroxiredoxin (alkyl hydroperoxide reductase subunit C)